MCAPRRDAVCSPLDAAQACPARWQAVARGDFYFSFRRNGWLWKRSKSPQRPWQVCPWCGHMLPGAELLYSRFRGRHAAAP